MKNKFLFVLVASVFVAILPAENAKALSCLQSFPLVGTVSKVSEQDSFTEIVLEKYYTFDVSDLTKEKLLPIDRYEEIAGKYTRGEFKASNVPSSEQMINRFSVDTATFKKAGLGVGDIVVKGPPFHVCDYGFIGIFSKNGKLREAMVKGNYDDFSYKNSPFEVEAGKEFDCDNDGRCKAVVNFTTDEEEFALSPGQSKKISKGPIKTVFLADSGTLKARSSGEIIVFDWGMSTFANYVLGFSDSATTTPPQGTGSDDRDNPEAQNNQDRQAENRSVFRLIIAWITGIFR